MRRILIITFSVLCSLGISAQEETSDIQAVFDACVRLRDAVAANDSASIKQSANDLKDCNIADFSKLRCDDDSVTSLNGHMVFDPVYADSLVGSKDAYENADSIVVISLGRSDYTDDVDVMVLPEQKRGQTADGSIFTKTCFVKAGKSTKYSFLSRGTQELAVVAEPGGRLTMKIHVTNSKGFNKTFNDTKQVKKGMPQRKRVIQLPFSPVSKVELEIVNCGNKDTSFVVISN